MYLDTKICLNISTLAIGNSGWSKYKNLKFRTNVTKLLRDVVKLLMDVIKVPMEYIDEGQHLGRN
jgi:hypothetical protein